LIHRGNSSVVRSWHFVHSDHESPLCSADQQGECRSIGERVSVITRLGSQLLVAHGPTVSYVSTSKWTPTVTCGGRGLQSVSAFAVDAFSSAMLHIAYADGRVLLYRAKSGIDNQKSSCRVMHQLLPPDESEQSASVAAVSRGFVVTASANKLNIFNTTFVASDTPPRLVVSKQLSFSSKGDSKNGTNFFFSASSPALVGSASEVLFVHSFDTHVSAFESLIKYEPQGRDVAWMRMPIIFVGLIVVFGYQIMKRNGSTQPRGYGSVGSGGGNTPDFGGAEMQRILEQMGRSQAGGGLHSHRD